MTPKNTKHLAAGSLCPPLTKDLLRLYSMFYCPFAQRTRMVLALKNVPHETVNINLTHKPEWFLEISPLGKVPTLQLGDKIMYESMITCDYLDETVPDPPLYPSDPWSKGVDRALIEAFGSKVIPNYYKAYRSAKEPEKIPEIADAVKSGLDFFEEELKKRGTTFFFGDRPGMLDYAIFPWFERFPIVQGVFPAFEILSEERFPRLSKYSAEMHKDEAAKSTICKFTDGLNMFKTVIDDGPTSYDIGV